jgi:iron complex transport system substrate-binding protein
MVGLLGALLLAGAPAFAQVQPPQRVMSLNMCTDQLILNLLPPSRITSVTFLSHASPNATLSAQARQTGINYGTAEEVLAQRPDLIVSGDSSTPTTRAILDRAGYRLYEVASADTFEEIRETTRDLGRALGEERRAEALLARMDATLSGLCAPCPPEGLLLSHGTAVVSCRGADYSSMKY